MSLGIGPHDHDCTCPRCESRRRINDIPVAFLCPSCESVHFNVRWSIRFFIWQICCEGCGSVYDLIASGTAQVHSR